MMGNTKKWLVGIVMLFLVIGGCLAYIVHLKSNEQVPKSVVVEKIQNLNELVTAEALTKVVIEKENNKIFGKEIGLDFPGTKQKLLVIIPGTVKAGIHLEKITEQDITINEKEKTAVLKINQPQVLEAPALDVKNIKVFSSEGVFRAEASAKEGFSLAEEAQNLMTKEAIEEGLLERARSNAETSLKNLFNLVDYEIEVEFKE